ncbi:MAG: sigma 54-interacting transcriptional regulator [Nannocystaceae bacterium]
MSGSPEDAPEATVRRDSRPAGGRRTLQVLGQGFHASYPLASEGRVTIGRSSENLVAIDDLEISRHHLVLHVRETISLEDLGSSNGTWVGDRQLEPRSVTTLHPGEPVRIGSTTLIVLERAVEPSSRRLWSYDYFEARVDEECRRAARSGTVFALLHPLSAADRGRCGRAAAGRAVARSRRRRALRARRVAGAAGRRGRGPGRRGRGATRRRSQRRARGRAAAAAAFPIDGTTADALVTTVAARVDGGDDDDDEGRAQGPVVEDPVMRELYRLVERVAPSRLHVLVLGETGSGKDVIAEELHRRSGRADRALRRIECAALPPERAHEVLFGGDDGGGALAAAQGGTLLLDEVGQLAPEVQARLLVALDEQGAALDLRVVATSNRDLEQEVAAGHSARISTSASTASRSRCRRCVAGRPRSSLCERFLQEAAQGSARAEVPTVSAAALTMLSGYPWPGNVRELRNVMRRALLLCDGDEIQLAHLPIDKLGAAFAAPSQEGTLPPAATVPPLREVKEKYVQAERQRIIDALERCHGNQTEAAKLLGIARRTLIKRLDAYGLPRPRKK